MNYFFSMLTKIDKFFNKNIYENNLLKIDFPTPGVSQTTELEKKIVSDV